MFFNTLYARGEAWSCQLYVSDRKRLSKVFPYSRMDLPFAALSEWIGKVLILLRQHVPVSFIVEHSKPASALVHEDEYFAGTGGLIEHIYISW